MPHIESLESRIFLSTTSAALVWKTVASMPVPRAEGGSFIANGLLYTFGGFNPGGSLSISNEMDAYNPATNKWTQMANVPVKVNDDPVAVDPVTDIAWIGGFFLNDGVHPSGLVYEYHIKTNTWTQGPSLPETIGAGAMAVVGRELHYWGGRNINNIGTTAQYRLNLNDPSAGWVIDTPLPLTTNHVASAVVNGKIYSIGGIINKEETDSNETNVWVYDPSTRKWSAAAPLPFGLGHIAMSATVFEGKIIVAGGELNDGTKFLESNAVLEFDPATNKWTSMTNLPATRQSAMVGAIGNELIVCGGNMYSSPYVSSTTWEASLAGQVNTDATISGKVFDDLNDSGVYQSNDPTLAGWGAFIDNNGDGVYDAGDLRVVSDINGNYSFVLPPGTYHINEGLPAGWSRKTPGPKGYTITVTAGEVVTGINFGNHY